MKLKAIHYSGIGAGGVLIVLSLIFMSSKYFFLLLGTGVIAGVLPFVLNVMYENRVEQEKEQMFLEFARNLVESVKAGTPISKSIINIKDKSYGVLSPHVKKLANQITLGIPLNTAFKNFAEDIGNKSMSRSITLIGQAERAGGDIGEILEAVAGAVSMSDKLRKEREASISSLVVQGYIIFLAFTIIILVMQFKILPLVSGITLSGDLAGIGGGAGLTGAAGATTGVNQAQSFANSFLYLLLVQGFFSGLAIGKLSGGGVKAGLKHSFYLMFMSFFISTVAGLFF